MTLKDKIKAWLIENSGIQFESDEQIEQLADSILKLTADHLDGVQLELPVVYEKGSIDRTTIVKEMLD